MLGNTLRICGISTIHKAFSPRCNHLFKRSLASESKLRYLELDNGNKLAYRAFQGENPGVIFCPGFQSNMQGVKAMALEKYCEKKGLSFLRFDYEGCGESSGDIREMTLTDWNKNALTVLDTLTAGPQILVGSSMGGWISMMVAMERPHRIHSLIGIATAADFPQRGFSYLTPELQDEVAKNSEISFSRDNRTYLVTEKFLTDLRTNHPVIDEIDVTCVVHILHGMADSVIPHETTIDLVNSIRSQHVQLLLSKMADHRFSQPDDIQLIFETLNLLVFGQKEVRDLALSSWSSFSVTELPLDHIYNKDKVIRKY